MYVNPEDSSSMAAGRFPRMADEGSGQPSPGQAAVVRAARPRRMLPPSGSVPAFVEQVTGRSISPIGETEFNRMYVVTLSGDEGEDILAKY